MPSHRDAKVAVVKVLKDEGYIADFAVVREGRKASLNVQLKYHEGRPVIDRIDRVSRPGLRIYRGREGAAAHPRWDGHCDRLDAQGRDDGRPGARERAGRRSSLHRVVR